MLADIRQNTGRKRAIVKEVIAKLKEETQQQLTLWESLANILEEWQPDDQPCSFARDKTLDFARAKFFKCRMDLEGYRVALLLLEKIPCLATPPKSEESPQKSTT